MDEYLKIIWTYLPIQFIDEDVNEFIEYLSEAYLENIEKGKYQFAFTAFHMLNMVFIYKTKWFLKGRGNPTVENSLQVYIQTNKWTTFNTLFDLSLFQEKKSLETILQSLSFHANDIGICKNHVDVRNNCSHASGRIYYKTQDKIEHYIKEEIEFIEKIQKKLESELKNFLTKFLDENWNKQFISGDFQNLFKENYFSLKDLESISTLDLPLFKRNSDTEKNIRQKIIYLLLIYEIQTQIETEKNLFIEKLKILLTDLPEKIKVIKDGDEIDEDTSRIIEENILPLSSQLNSEDWKEIETILKL